VEHYQKYEGDVGTENGGTDIFFQNEMPYDPAEPSSVDGGPRSGRILRPFKVADSVTSFSGYGMGSYSFFNQGVNINAANAFEVPANLSASSLHDLLTIFLSTSGFGWHPERRQ